MNLIKSCKANVSRYKQNYDSVTLMAAASLGEEIANEVNKAYEKLGPSCKPVVRSNGVKEWTVLAGVVAVDRYTKGLRLVSVATGVKAMPDALLARGCGKIVHDCHAEILALRALNTVLLKQMEQLKKNPAQEQDLIKLYSPSGLYILKDNWELALYISTLPCGDASMDLLMQEDEGAMVQDNDCIQYVDPTITTILRGRLNYSRRRIVRTKPGRFDSKITLSKSCSDKLCIKQAVSVLNCITWSLMAEPVYLKYLVCPGRLDNLRQSFHDRMQDQNSTPFLFLRCSQNFIDGKQSNEEQPSSMSSVKLFSSEKDIVEEAILNGLKNGFYTKESKPLRKNCEPIVSRYTQWRIYKKLRTELPCMSYLQFKAHSTRRNELLSNVRRHLSPQGWISTSKDDCQ